MSCTINLTQPHPHVPEPKKRKPTKDELLRMAGYRIMSRRIGEEAIWQDTDGRLWMESQITVEAE